MRRRDRAVRWRSITRWPRSSASRRFSTASIAARFSATNSTRWRRAARVAMRFAIVWLLPVPGGPFTTRLLPATTELIA